VHWKARETETASGSMLEITMDSESAVMSAILLENRKALSTELLTENTMARVMVT